MTEPVVISGVGTLGNFGAGAEALRAALAASSPAVSEVDRSGGFHRAEGSRLAASVGGLDLSPWVPRAKARRMSGPSKLAVAAARMAIEEAGLTRANDEWENAGVFLATTFGPADFTERLFRTISTDGPEAASPMLFTESVANAPTAQIAIHCRARGSNVTVTQREAGPLIAVAHAATEVAEGRVSRALAGSVEEMTPLVHALLDRFGALARGGPDRIEQARPFDRRRDGFLAGEGATVWVLERESAVRARGGRGLARVRGGARAFDPSASRVGWGQGAESLSVGLVGLLSRLCLKPESVDLIVSGASGARGGDRLEARVLKRVFGPGVCPPILAPKSLTGEYGGGLLGSAALAVAGGHFGPTVGFGDPDPDLGVVPWAGGTLAAGRVLVTSLAAGGAAAWLVLESP